MFSLLSYFFTFGDLLFVFVSLVFAACFNSRIPEVFSSEVVETDSAAAGGLDGSCDFDDDRK
jgi:hypothetical protein